MAVKEVFILNEGVVITKLHDGVMVGAVPEPAQAGVGQSLQCPPEHLVLHPAHIEDDTSVEGPGLEDEVGLGGQRGQGVCPDQSSALLPRPAPAPALIWNVLLPSDSTAGTWSTAAWEVTQQLASYSITDASLAGVNTTTTSITLRLVSPLELQTNLHKVWSCVITQKALN